MAVQEELQTHLWCPRVQP